MHLPKNTTSILLLFCVCFAGALHAQPVVKTGLDQLVAQQFKQLAKKHVGLIANQTSKTSAGAFGPMLFKKAKSVKLVALFAPEHGLSGTRSAGIATDSIERFMNVPVYSLYGSTRKPTKKMLKGIDALVFDLQDIGVRPYTYLSTMISSMEAAAESHIPFYVLDRPNPLSGIRIEGNILETSLKSFVGIADIPYLHGMTLGELAKMAVDEEWFANAASLKLTVIEMSGWKRAMYWPETGLSWVATSPNIPHFENAVGAAALGASGELGILTIGIGGERPFLALGATASKTDAMLQAAQSAFPHELTFKLDSFYAVYNGIKKHFAGVTIGVPKDLAHLGPLYQGQFILLQQLLTDSTFGASFDGVSTSQMLMFEKVTGTKQVWEALDHSTDISSVIDRWQKDVATFATRRKPYLIYQ
jgi:uncharacterized protein YbbC (DUF1343 family)